MKIAPTSVLLHTASGVMGTPAYMAPEQHAKKADIVTDVWGLGTVLYELLTLPAALSRPEAQRAAPHGSDNQSHATAKARS